MSLRHANEGSGRRDHKGSERFPVRRDKRAGERHVLVKRNTPPVFEPRWYCKTGQIRRALDANEQNAEPAHRANRQTLHVRERYSSKEPASKIARENLRAKPSGFRGGRVWLRKFKEYTKMW